MTLLYISHFWVSILLFQLSAAGSAGGSAETGMGNKVSSSGGGNAVTGTLAANSDVNELETPQTHNECGGSSNITHRLPSNGEDGEEPVGEVPPPMQPISSIPVKPSELPCPPGIDKVNIKYCSPLYSTTTC